MEDFTDMEVQALRIAFGRSRLHPVHFLTNNINRMVKAAEYLLQQYPVTTLTQEDSVTLLTFHPVRFMAPLAENRAEVQDWNVSVGKKGNRQDKRQWEVAVGLREYDGVKHKNEETNPFKGGADDARRCTATKSRSTERCRRWRCHDSGDLQLCTFHHKQHRRQRMPSLYTRVVNPQMKKLIEEGLSSGIGADHVSIMEELQLMRLHCADFVKLYSQCDMAVQMAQKTLTANGEPDHDLVEKMTESKMSAGTLMAGMLEKVAALAEKAAKIHFGTKEAYTAQDLKVVADQMTRMLYEVCGEHHEWIAEDFAEKVKVQLQLPSEIEGTLIQPGDDVLAMDSTIPYMPEAFLTEDEDTSLEDDEDTISE